MDYSKEKLDEELNKINEETSVPNILICGQTGIGKSSAINYIFRKEVAVTSSSEPCTREIIKHKGDQVTIFDSEGYEIGSDKQDKYESMIFDNFLLERKDINNTDEAIHIVWYGISGAGKRITDLDISLINRISKEGYRVGILLTKIDEMDQNQLDGMEETLKKEFKNIPFFKLSIDENLLEYTEWEQLIEWSYSVLPEVCRSRFVSALKGNLELKKKEANVAIGLAATASAGVAVSPIPFSDSALLIPIQTGMVIKILSLYGYKVEKSAVVSLIGSSAVSSLGKTLVGSLVKLIPGVGSVIGAAINTTVASSLTFAIGKALLEIIHNQAKKIIDGEEISFDIGSIIEGEMFTRLVKEFFKSKEGKDE